MKKVSLFLVAAMLLCVSSVSYSQSKLRRTDRQFTRTNSVSSIGALGVSSVPPVSQLTVRKPQNEKQYLWIEDEEEEGTWMPIQEINYQYNSRGQVETSNTVSLLIGGEKRTTHSYDAQGRDTLILNQAKVGNNWVNASRTRIKYDQDGGHNSYYGTFKWNVQASQWDLEYASKFTHTYDNNFRLMESVSAKYEDGSWSEMGRSVYEYAGNSPLPVSITSYDHIEGQWVPDERLTELVYTASSMEQSYVMQDYTGGSGEAAWGNDSRHTFTYSIGNAANVTTMEEVIEVPQGSGWTQAIRITVGILQGSGHIVQYKEEIRDNNQWVLDMSISQNYQYATDTHGSITDLIVSNYEDNDQGEAELVNFMRYAFSDFVSISITGAKEEVLAGATQMYPNPVTDKLHIALDVAKVQEARLSVHSITGQKMFELNSLRGEATIDVSALPGGVYFVRVTGADNTNFTRKIVKQ